MDESIQQIQPLLITENKRQFYFGWKPPDRVGIVETSTSSPLLSLIAAKDSWNPSRSILALHTRTGVEPKHKPMHMSTHMTCAFTHVNTQKWTSSKVSIQNVRQYAKGETKHWFDASVFIFSSVWSSLSFSHTHAGCLHANILQVWSCLSSGRADRRKGHHLTACDGANWCPVASGK